VAISVAPRAPEAPVRARSLGGRLSSALLALSLALAAAVGAAALAGYRGEVILTGSMEPTLSPGDLVVVKKVAASELAVGDVVSFRDRHGTPITHRVEAVRATRSGELAVRTRGDANNAPERWRTAPDATVGRRVATVPAIGKVTDWSGTPTGRLIVFGLFGTLVAGMALRRIWRS
jgi:signal peptidase